MQNQSHITQSFQFLHSHKIEYFILYLDPRISASFSLSNSSILLHLSSFRQTQRKKVTLKNLYLLSIKNFALALDPQRAPHTQRDGEGVKLQTTLLKVQTIVILNLSNSSNNLSIPSSTNDETEIPNRILL